MTEDKKLELEDIVHKLIALGEDERELKFWLSIFDELRPDEQADLLRNLGEELKELESKI